MRNVFNTVNSGVVVSHDLTDIINNRPEAMIAMIPGGTGWPKR